MSTDSTDSDVTPAHRPIIVAACHDVIDGHLPLSWQRDVTVHECVSQVAMKVEQTDNDDDESILGRVQQDDTAIASHVSTVDVPQGRRHSPPDHHHDDDDDDDMQPLDLTQRHVSASNTSSPSADARLSSCTQILLLKGERYEIMPVGDGRWISRNEYELIDALQNGADHQRRRLSLTDDSSSDRPYSNSNSTPPAHDADDKPLNDVNGNTCDVSTGTSRDGQDDDKTVKCENWSD